METLSENERKLLFRHLNDHRFDLKINLYPEEIQYLIELLKKESKWNLKICLKKKD